MGLSRIMQALTAAAWIISAVCFAIFVWQINDGEPFHVCAAWFFAWAVPLGFGIWAYREVRDLALAERPTPQPQYVAGDD